MSNQKAYNTKGRQIILDLVRSSDDGHITAAAVSQKLAESGASLGTATIYRQLEKLADEGVLRKYFIDGVPAACFELVEKHNDCDTHVHFKCEECGELCCIDCEEMKAIEKHFAAEHGISIDPVRTVLYGKCKACREKGTK